MQRIWAESGTRGLFAGEWRFISSATAPQPLYGRANVEEEEEDETWTGNDLVGISLQLSWWLWASRSFST